MHYAKHATNHMIDGQLLTNRVVDPRLLSAIKAVPRERCVPDSLAHVAYVDEDLEIAPGRYLMEPMVFARLLQMTAPEAHHKALVIGCGTGYSAAILAHLVQQVVAIEAQPELAEKARHVLHSLGLKQAEIINAPHAAGYAQYAPYDVILIDGAVQEVPAAILAQLAENGRLVTVQHIAEQPVGGNGLGRATLYHKIHGESFARSFFDASVALLPGFEKKPSFAF